MKKIFKILLTISLLLSLSSCKGNESELNKGESYAFSENGLYSFIYVSDDYALVNFSGGDSTFVIDDTTLVEVTSAQDATAYADLDEFCETLPAYAKYETFFKDFDFSNYTVTTLNKIKDVRYYEKKMEAQDSDLEMKPATVQIYIFKGENGWYVITAGYMDHKKDESTGKIRLLIDTFAERSMDDDEG